MHAAYAALVHLTDQTERTSETHNELAMSPEAYGLTALGVLLLLLLATWAFRSVGTRH